MSAMIRGEKGWNNRLIVTVQSRDRCLGYVHMFTMFRSFYKLRLHCMRLRFATCDVRWEGAAPPGPWTSYLHNSETSRHCKQSERARCSKVKRVNYLN